MRQITHIVLHCTATPQTTSVASIQKYWRESLGWKSPGYHHIIKFTGEVVDLLPIEQVSNGVAGHNAHSIHISYVGGVDAQGRAVDNRTAEQISAQVTLLKNYKAMFPDAIICGHRDFPGVKKECPSFDVKSWLKTITLFFFVTLLAGCLKRQPTAPLRLHGAYITTPAELVNIPILTARKKPKPPADTTGPGDTIVIPPAPLPTSYSLMMPAIGYQGSEGSCVAWAVAYGARSSMQYYKTGASSFSYSSNIFSPEYVFNQVKANTYCGSSSMLRAIELLKSQGVCTWQSMPYSYLNGCSQVPTSAQLAEAANYKVASYVRVLPGDQVTIKTMIASNKPVPFTFNTDANYDRATAGFIWKTYSGFTGAHAMVICGYDDAKHAYKAMNCWGTAWGDAGYIWIDYDLLPVISFEAYVMNL